jgi:type II secretory pathway component PulF
MKNASAYPMFVLFLGLVSVTVIVTWILPGIMKTMDMDPSVMPWPTRFLLGSSTLVRAVFTTVYGWCTLALLVSGVCYAIHWIRTDGKLYWDGFRLRIPMLGSVLRTIAVGRFARTLGSLTQGGVIILESLAVVRDTLGNEVLAREIDMVAEEVKKGEPLSVHLDKSGYFPPLLIQIVAVGEQTGKLDELLLNAADTFDEEADAAITRFMSVFPAVLILLLALIVGFIIIATLLPMVMMQGALG